jgi:hypothetical protein
MIWLFAVHLKWPASSSSTRTAVAPGCGYESGTRRRVRFLAGQATAQISTGRSRCGRRANFKRKSFDWRSGRGPNVQEAPTKSSARDGLTAHMSILIIALDSRMSWRTRRSSARAARVYRPCFSAFLLPRGAPEPGAPPCIRHRAFPLTAGAMHGLPERVLAPQRGLESIGPTLQ